MDRVWHAKSLLNINANSEDTVPIPGIDTSRARIRFNIDATGGVGATTPLASTFIGAVELGAYDGKYVPAASGAELKRMARFVTPGKDGGHVVDDTVTEANGESCKGIFQVDVSMAMLFASVPKTTTLRVAVNAVTGTWTAVNVTVDIELYSNFKTRGRAGFGLKKMSLAAATSHRQTFGQGRGVAGILVYVADSTAVSDIIMDKGEGGEVTYIQTELQSYWANWKEATALETGYLYIPGYIAPQFMKTFACTMASSKAIIVYSVEEIERFVINKTVEAPAKKNSWW